MKILFDQGAPVPLRRELQNHEVKTAFEMQWSELVNGELLEAAEASFDALITTDKNLRYQQNLAGRRIAVLVLPTTSWPKIKLHTDEVRRAVDSLKAGDFVELTFTA